MDNLLVSLVHLLVIGGLLAFAFSAHVEKRGPGQHNLRRK